MTGVRCHAAMLALATGLMLAGCGGVAPPLRLQQYTLVPVPASGAGDRRATVTGPVLRIAGIDAPTWLNSTRMYYRLDYRADAKIAAYSRSAWVAPPPVLLAEVLQDALAGMTRWKAVLGPEVAADADSTLRITLNAFQQVFASRTRSAGVIDATATLLGGEVIAQRRFHVAVPASSADARGGAKALSRAGRELAGRIRDWIAVVFASAAAGAGAGA